MKCDELKAYKADVTIPVYGTIADAEVYLKDKVDNVVSEKDHEIARLNTEIKEAVKTMKSQDVEIMELKRKLDEYVLVKLSTQQMPQEGRGIQMTQEELDKIVEQHQHWLKADCEGWEGMRANLTGANLTGANLTRANLAGAYLTGANLTRANLTRANLADANLAGANLADAYLAGANLADANLTDANLTDADQFRLGKVLDEPLVGYKKTKEGVVITAEIPSGAIVFCINGSKCRTNRAKITDMEGHEVLHSRYDNSFEYRLGQEINIKDFNLMYNVECASGFHFFRTRNEAEEY